MQEWLKYVLSKFMIRFKDKLALDHNKSYQEWIRAKSDFELAKRVAVPSKSDSESIRKKLDVHNSDSVSYDPLHGLRKVAEMYLHSLNHHTGDFKIAPSENQNGFNEKQRQRTASITAAKRKLTRKACAVVQSEIKVARCLEILTSANVLLNQVKYEKARRQVDKKRANLQKALQDLRQRIDDRNFNVRNLDLKMSAVFVGDSLAAVVARTAAAAKARIKVEIARLSPQVTESRVAVATLTVALLEGIAVLDGATAVHMELLNAKSRSRIRTRLAESRLRSVAWACQALQHGSDTPLLSLHLSSDDSAELDVLSEPAAAVEKRKWEADDLLADTLIGRARVTAEIAEAALWTEWARVAVAQQSDRPLQGTGSPIYTKASQVDAANAELRAAAAAALRHKTHSRPQTAHGSESALPPHTKIAGTVWIPKEAVSEDALAAAVRRLTAPAERALWLALERLQRPAVPEQLEQGDLREAVARLDGLAARCTLLGSARR